MRLLLAALCLLLLTGSAWAAPLAPRTKPGPVTIRGVASGVSVHGFTLHTTSHGTYTVDLASATSVVSKGKTGHLTVQNGDHVGVHGFLSGRTIRAISVRLYPVKPKQSSLRGTVVSLRHDLLVISVAGKLVTVRLTSQTQLSTSRGPASTSDLKRGSRVLVRVEQIVPLTAIRVRIYLAKVAARHVQLHGTIVTVTTGAIVIAVGSTRTRVGVNGQTVIHQGLALAGASALADGETITVHACCAGKPLLATTIHIDKTSTSQHSALVRGRVVAITNSNIRIAVGTQATNVVLQPSTIYDVGSTPTDRSGIHVGDQVSIRITTVGGHLRAERVHVYLSSRRPKSFDGTVVGISHGSITIDVRGQRESLPVDPRATISLGGRSVALPALHTGDRVRAQGLPGGNGAYVLHSIIATRKPPKAAKEQTVRGTLISAQGSLYVIADASGVRHRVRLMQGVRPSLHGKPAPLLAIFPGVTAHVRGRPNGNVLLATSLTLTVRSGTVKGRVASINGGSMSVQLSSGAMRQILLPAGSTAQDGSRREPVRAVHVGAYVVVTGYVASPAPLRAVSVTVLHVSIDTAAVVASIHGGITVRTSKGERYLLHFSPSSTITAEHGGLSLSPLDVPVGVRVHVQGALDSSGRLAVTTLVVYLSSVTIRGTITVGQTWTVTSGSTTSSLRLAPGTPFSQGTRTLTAADVVTGDDVTVYGYALAGGLILVRRIDVHRKLGGFDGTVLSLTVDGFILQAADGTHRVITNSTTLLSGVATQVAPNFTVHVTGYVRGDGVILATRVRVVKA